MTTRIDNDLQKEDKRLAIDLKRPFNERIEEALRDLNLILTWNALGQKTYFSAMDFLLCMQEIFCD